MNANAFHRLLEQFPVFRFLNRFEISADQFDAKPIQGSIFGKSNRQVEGGLPSHRWEQGIGPLKFNHLSDNVWRERLDIRAVRHFRIRHDRGRI